jgi:hypothetical protein
MRLLVFGLLFAAAIYLLTAGHVLFLPLLLFLPLGGLFGRRRRGYGNDRGRRGGFLSPFGGRYDRRW